MNELMELNTRERYDLLIRDKDFAREAFFDDGFKGKIKCTG